MASARVLTCRTRMVAYLPSLHSAVRHFRAFSSHDERTTPGAPLPVDSGVDTVQPTDCHLGILAPRDKRFPLPGMQGPAAPAHGPGMLESKDLSPRQQSSTEATRSSLPDLLTEPAPAERQLGTLGQYLIAAQNMPDSDLVENEHLMMPTSLDKLECVALECPQLLRREFSDLFPERDLATSALTVITISQKTENDMSGWSSEVEQEREALLEQFMQGAQDICAALKEAGFWADFVDPASGRPFYSSYTNATFFETDERYKELGFEIEDLGCCRVISHHIWGKHAYVGCLFTDAPANHPIITDMTKDPNYQ